MKFLLITLSIILASCDMTHQKASNDAPIEGNDGSPIDEQDPGQGNDDRGETPPNDNQPPPPSDGYLTAARQIFNATNQFRASQGQPPLGFSLEWSWAAYEWSRKQAEAGGISHDGFPQERIGSVQARFPGFDTSFQSGGENVLWNMTGVSGMVNQWANSPGHRTNMLRGYSIMGAGAYEKNGRYYGTQIFILE